MSYATIETTDRSFGAWPFYSAESDTGIFSHSAYGTCTRLNAVYPFGKFLHFWRARSSSNFGLCVCGREFLARNSTHVIRYKYIQGKWPVHRTHYQQVGLEAFKFFNGQALPGRFWTFTATPTRARLKIFGSISNFIWTWVSRSGHPFDICWIGRSKNGPCCFFSLPRTRPSFVNWQLVELFSRPVLTSCVGKPGGGVSRGLGFRARFPDKSSNRNRP